MMESASLLKSLLNLMHDFSAKLPSGLVKVAPITEEDISFSFYDLNESICQLSADLKKLSDKSKAKVSSETVQITASKSQVDQRIAAFISHSQNAVDQQNIHEFFLGSNNVQSGCARTRAVYRRRPARGTHVQVNRVKNEEGPQTQVNSQGRWCALKRDAVSEPINCPESVKERLANLEDHLRISKNTAPKDVYDRLKSIEDKVLELESISPEYFRERDDKRIVPTATTSASDNRQMSIDQIDDRIRLLKNQLLSKRRKI